MTDSHQPADAFPPGDFLKEELQAREWTYEDFAKIIGRNPRTVSDLVCGKRSVTPETAQCLSAALGTTAQFWLNLESSYRLWLSRSDSSEEVARRAHLYTIAPIKDMVRRGWIDEWTSADSLETELQRFFGVESLCEPIRFPHAARKSTAYEVIEPAQNAWLFRCRLLSRCVSAAQYSKRNFNTLLRDLKPLMYSPEDIRHVPVALGNAGVKLVIVECLPGTKIDGAAFWVDDSPVIALSTRYNRIDNFWFTLLHEIGHISQGIFSLDLEIDVESEELPEPEKQANAFAENYILPEAEVESLIARSSPVYRRKQIEGFAHIHGIHPGIVVGRLHHRKEVKYSNFRQLLVSVREHVSMSAVVDGWGSVIPVY